MVCVSLVVQLVQCCVCGLSHNSYSTYLAMIRSVVKQKLNVSTSSSTPIPIETSDENTANPTEADSQEEYGVVKEKDDTEAESKILSDSVPATTNDPAGDQEEKGSEKEDAEDNKLKDGNTPETDDRLPETGEPPEMQAKEEVEDNIEADGDGADQTTKETPKTGILCTFLNLYLIAEQT